MLEDVRHRRLERPVRRRDARPRAEPRWKQARCCIFPICPSSLPDSENEFLDAALTDGKAKNISLDHTSGKLQGTSADGRTGRAAGRHDRALRRRRRRSFVNDLLPNYAGVERARTSYRPVEVEGRAYSVIQDDRLLHIDAFPSRPMQNGRRILRFFANVAPPWRQRAPLAGGRAFRGFRRAIPARASSRICPARAGCSKSWASRADAAVAYDEMMLSLHDAAKRDARLPEELRRTPRWIFRPAPAGWSIPTRCCMPRWTANSPWSRPSISTWRRWASRTVADPGAGTADGKGARIDSGARDFRSWLGASRGACA